MLCSILLGTTLGTHAIRAGGAEENRTPDLRIANATLSQLSYRPVTICAPNDNQKSLERQRALERVMGIEPTLSAWEAEVLPLNYTRATPQS